MENDADQSDIDEITETPTTSIALSSTTRVHESISCNASRPQSSSRKRKMPPNDDKTMEVMTLVGKKLNSLKADDSFDVFGKYVANKLRNLNKQQSVFSQKLINDVLFEAEMESLTRNFKVVDLGEPRNDFRSKGYYEWPQNISPQIGQYQILQQTGEQNIPSQVGQFQQMPQ